MKIGIISDMHLMLDQGNSSPIPIYGTTRLKEIYETVLNAWSIFKEEDVSLILDAGDPVDDKNSVPIPVLWAYSDIIRRAPAPIITVPSNHASYDKAHLHLCFVFEDFSWMSQCDGYKVARTDGQLFKEVRIYGIPHKGDSCFNEFKESVERVNSRRLTETNGKGINILLLHQGIMEAEVKNAPAELEKNVSAKKLEKWFPWVDLIVAGHYHDPQMIGKKVVIPGAVCQHSFRDCGSKRGVWIYDTKTGGIKFIKIVSPKFHQTTFAHLSERLDNFKEGDYVKVKISKSSELQKVREITEKKNLHISYLLQQEKEKEELRDSTITFTNDDYSNLVKYIENKKPQNLSPKILKHFGKKIIEQATKEADKR